jgi:dolichol-phosphate mannosyltransferase
MPEPVQRSSKAAAPLTVVVPTYNERENIDPLVTELAAADHRGQIKRVICVDDNSPDGTAEHIKSRRFPLDVVCLHRCGRLGLSSAVIDGALAADTEYVAVMDADGQHAPTDLMQMLDAMITEDADLCIGSRFLGVSEQEAYSRLRASISAVGNKLSSVILGLQVSDPLTGLFIIKRTLLTEAARRIRPSGFKILLDILHALKRSRIKIIEKQIAIRSRLHGKSKLDAAVLVEFVKQVLAKYQED